MAVAEPPSLPPPPAAGRPADRSLAVRPMHDVNIVHGNVYEDYADYTKTAVAAPHDSHTLFLINLAYKTFRFSIYVIACDL